MAAKLLLLLSSHHPKGAAHLSPS